MLLWGYCDQTKLITQRTPLFKKRKREMQNMNLQKQLWSVSETSCLFAVWSLVETKDKPKGATRMSRSALHSPEKKSWLCFSESMALLSHYSEKQSGFFLRIIFLSVQERESHSVPVTRRETFIKY